MIRRFVQYLRDVRDGLNSMVGDSLELLAARLALMAVGWRTARTVADDIRDLADAWADAQRALNSAATQLIADHYRHDDAPWCRICGPEDGHWPCAVREVADEMAEAAR